MAYPPLLNLPNEAAYRAHFHASYCAGPVFTFDSILVRFRKNDFDHCFFESSRRDGNKDAFSTQRAERMEWIKAALQDRYADLFVGWDKARKRPDPHRRVCLVCSNYVVVIRMTGPKTADFVTAFVADTPSTLAKIRKSARWT